MNCKDTQAAIDVATRRSPVSQSASTHIAGCTDCRQYANQSDTLLALLGAQPRVEAPADFGFHLRARIARAAAHPAGSFGFLEKFFGQSFSIKQAAASLAALAVTAAATTFYFIGGSQPVMNVATVAPVERQAAPAISQVVVPSEQKMIAPVVNTPRPALKAATTSRVSAAKVISASLPREANIAAASMDRVYVRGKGQVMEIPTRTVFGAEGSVAKVKPAVYTAGL